jgi:hypothetical protein
MLLHLGEEVIEPEVYVELFLRELLRFPEGERRDPCSGGVFVSESSPEKPKIAILYKRFRGEVYRRGDIGSRLALEEST